MRTRLWSVAVLAVVMCLQESVVRAEILLGNLAGVSPSDSPPNGLTPLNSPLGSDVLTGVGAQYNSKAVGFHVPAATSFQLDFFRVWLTVNANSVPVASLYGDDPNGYPGTLLETLVYTPGTSSTFASFQSPSAFVLNADTTYWMVLHNAATVADTMSWFGLAPPNSVLPTGSTSFVGYRFELNANPPTLPSSLYNFMSISGTALPSGAIPEPSSFGLCLMAGCSLACLSRRLRGQIQKR